MFVEWKMMKRIPNRAGVALVGQEQDSILVIWTFHQRFPHVPTQNCLELQTLADPRGPLRAM